MAERVFTQVFGVVGAIIERDGKILLIKEAESYASGKWSHPAGWINVGENPIVAAEREVIEETGFQFTATNILGIYSLVKIKTEGGFTRHPLKIIFIGKISDKEIKKLESDVTETKWFTPEEIERMDADTLRDLDIKIMIKDYFEGKKYPLELITHTIQK